MASNNFNNQNSREKNDESAPIETEPRNANPGTLSFRLVLFLAFAAINVFIIVGPYKFFEMYFSERIGVSIWLVRFLSGIFALFVGAFYARWCWNVVFSPRLVTSKSMRFGLMKVCGILIFFFLIMYGLSEFEKYNSLGNRVIPDKNYQFFSPTGTPVLYYYRHADDKLEFFAKKGKHPQFQVDLMEVTPEIVKELFMYFDSGRDSMIYGYKKEVLSIVNPMKSETYNPTDKELPDQIHSNIDNAVSTVQSSETSGIDSSKMFVICLECSGAGSIENYTKCDQCNSAGRSLCNFCSGKGKLTCNSCEKGALICKFCDKTGNVNCVNCYSTGLSFCSYCKGSGKTISGNTLTNSNTYGSNIPGQHGVDYTYKKCSNCNGGGKENCKICMAKGSLMCKSCSGKGFMVCKVCDGSGIKDCHLCKGLGVSPINCLSCEGAGKIKTIIACSRCNGQGKVFSQPD